MNNLKNKFYQFMYGRYGYDELGRFLIWVALALCVIGIFWRNIVLSIIIWVVVIWNIYRCFSKNIVARRLENDKFMEATKLFRLRWKYRKGYVIFRCKSCKQIIRVPKGKGKIDITCPKCRTVVTKRT